MQTNWNKLSAKQVQGKTKYQYNKCWERPCVYNKESESEREGTREQSVRICGCVCLLSYHLCGAIVLLWALLASCPSATVIPIKCIPSLEIVKNVIVCYISNLNHHNAQTTCRSLYVHCLLNECVYSGVNFVASTVEWHLSVANKLLVS